MEYNEIKKLMEDMGNSKLSSVDIEFPDGIKIHMKKDENSFEHLNPVNKKSNHIETKESIEPNIEKEEKEEGNFVTSPMVGTFYLKPSPTSKPFVEVGSKVKKGDTLCIIEAMKLMNEIEAMQDGEIVEILVKEEEMVDYGKKLFRIK